jgi:hypothetical protein
MKTLIASILLGLTCVTAYAVPALFRIDTRSPDSVFRDGFTAPGTNRNLLQHAEGLSCGRFDGRPAGAAPEAAAAAVLPTAYIELNGRTGAPMVIRARLQMMARTQPNPIVWRYELTPSRNDYNVADTFAQRINPTTRVNLNTGRVAAAEMRARVQETWVAAAPIAGNRVMHGIAYTLERGRVIEVPGMVATNVNWVVAVTDHANENPLPIDTVVNGAAEPSIGRRILNVGDGLVSACACGGSFAADRSDTSNVITDDSACRAGASSVREVPEESSFSQITTPSGLDPKAHDDKIESR